MAIPFAHRLKPSHLRLIRAVHDTGKLHLAAGIAGMSQPAASRLLGEIETDIGGPLFERLPRGMAATPLGETFVRHARVILSEVEALSDNLVKLQGGRAGAVHVGSVTGPAVGVLLPALAALRSTAPDVQPTIEVAPSADLLRGLEDGRFDFVLARIGTDTDARTLRAHPGRTEQVRLLVGADHPLACRRVRLSETLAFEFVIQAAGSPIRTAVERTFLERGLSTPQRILNSSSLLIALGLIAQSPAIAPLTHEVAQVLARSNPRLVIVDVEEDIVVSPYLVLRSADRVLTPVAERLLDEVLRRL